MTDEHKVRDVRARRAAIRQGLRLERSRVRDPRAIDYGTYRLVNEATNEVVSSAGRGRYGLSLEQIEAILSKRPAAGSTT